MSNYFFTEKLDGGQSDSKVGPLSAAQPVFDPEPHQNDL